MAPLCAALSSGVRHVMSLSRQDRIWNRAALENGGVAPGIGDSAPASLLRVHGLAMNGGVPHAIQALSPKDREIAVAGFRHFGLVAAADVFAAPVDASEDEESSELRLNAAYLAAVPSDATIVQAFRQRLIAFPSEFSPLGADHMPNKSLERSRDR